MKPLTINWWGKRNNIVATPGAFGGRAKWKRAAGIKSTRKKSR